MPVIAPSILSADFANLERDIHDIERNGTDWVHVDVMDGIFVPNITIGIPVVKALRPVTSLPLDVHLMIDRPIRYAEEFIKAGADWLTIHLESDLLQVAAVRVLEVRVSACPADISGTLAAVLAVGSLSLEPQPTRANANTATRAITARIFFLFILGSSLIRPGERAFKPARNACFLQYTTNCNTLQLFLRKITKFNN